MTISLRTVSDPPFLLILLLAFSINDEANDEIPIPEHAPFVAPRIPSYGAAYDSTCASVIHFPECVNREEGGEGNPIRLHDPEASGTRERR